MLEFPFAYAYFLVPVMFAGGALEGALGVKPAFRLGVKPAAAMLLVTTGLMAWSVGEYVAIEEDFRIVRFEALRFPWTATQNRYAQSLDLEKHPQLQALTLP